ncbi:hypothetical protein R3P38DRAFT_315440 [Favolaschia claudopus]|uniref:Fungal-type protein kinase domain-containing protein n=1 Tax=Favolaschia claudopus TaxID=2862362 RepID=A0AAW0CUQ7_9AGAR
MAEQPAASGSTIKTTPPHPNVTTRVPTQTPNSPFKQTLVAHHVFRPGGKLAERRALVVESVGECCEVPLQFLCESVLSGSIFQTNPGFVARVADKLRKSGDLQRDGSWTKFSHYPSKVEGHEDDVFRPLAAVLNAIIKGGEDVVYEVEKGDATRPRAKIEFVNDPSKSPKGEMENATRPDTNGTVIDPGVLDLIVPQFRLRSWRTTAMPGEFKKDKHADKISDNETKNLWSARHIMTEDAARRFVLSFTVEDASMILWFFSRSQIMASERFDLIANPRTLIKMILSIAFAPVEQLGFDSTVSQLADEQGRPQFRYRLKGTTYIVRRIISEYHAATIRGRGTRVFEVYPEDDPSKSYVLKDEWISADYPTEATLLLLLHTLLQIGRQHFLTVHDHDFVRLSDGTIDSTSQFMGGNDNSPYLSTVKSKFESSKLGTDKGSRMVLGSGAVALRIPTAGLTPVVTFADDDAPAAMPFYGPRLHTRVVFEEVGTPIQDLTSMKRVLTCLQGAVTALNAIHNLGLVHRDLTPGNILDVAGVSKLTDLGYLKTYRDDEIDSQLQELLGRSSGKGVEAKTAIADFVAVEVMNGHYMFIPGRHMHKKTHVFQRVTRHAGHRVLRYWPHHDIEAILWILCWCVFGKKVAGRYTSAQKQGYKIYFGPKANAAERQEAIRSGPFLPLEGSLPDEFAAAAECLRSLFAELFERYEEFEATLDLEDLDVEGLHDAVAKAFETAVSNTPDIPFNLEPETAVQSGTSTEPNNLSNAAPTAAENDTAPTPVQVESDDELLLTPIGFTSKGKGRATAESESQFDEASGPQGVFQQKRRADSGSESDQGHSDLDESFTGRMSNGKALSKKPRLNTITMAGGDESDTAEDRPHVLQRLTKKRPGGR